MSRFITWVRYRVGSQSPGEAVIRAPYLTQGCLKNDEAGAKHAHGGWLHTDDIGRFRLESTRPSPSLLGTDPTAEFARAGIAMGVIDAAVHIMIGRVTPE